MASIGNNHRLIELKSRLQNPPQFWNGEDVVEWLRYIGLEQYAPNFSQLKIDGYLILDLTEDDLEGELQVSVKLHRKKIMKAIQELKLLEGTELPGAARNKPPPQRPAEPEQPNANSRTRPMEQLVLPQPFAQPPPLSPRKQYAADAPYIHIISLEGPTDVNHRVSTEPVSIGRHSSNQISIIDESVSRHHARIEFDGCAFQLQDVGSTTGTFIKVQEPLTLKEDMIIEIGSYQFQVSYVHIAREGEYPEESHVELTVYEAPEEVNDKYVVYSDSSIGRKSNCTLSFPDDLHMSNLHCKFNLIGDRFVFEDIASTNGSWLRLSKEGVTSPCFPLERNVVFKIGNTAMYRVRFPEARFGDARFHQETVNASAEKGEEAAKCCICWDNERDCLIMPCRHNVTCTKCVKSVKLCPFCRELIKDIIKIYK